MQKFFGRRQGRGKNSFSLKPFPFLPRPNEIFVRVFCPPRQRAGRAVLGVFYKIGSNFVVKIRNDKTFFCPRPAFWRGGQNIVRDFQ
ncbi:MAG: hypothetical protein A2812_00045 [Candidatus Staskawiczbacteria bacterium RIFCSPHIGHO2_01_FULL_36_16]|uniref:Uncharacterized protein n=1 Tax=Candidatus Staskawiczbacteria bacterium RIFCSPHIGHO2_01_FULL_36_16 TaxID=1802200 RepID=A0A1G2HSJ4_9BACT|nr:MAG: hypothetical protein A2812_00045 [Candidatus Staskawiczbacteria bacterium RIFCSPHIGHO2_01_FULL_36_16]